MYVGQRQGRPVQWRIFGSDVWFHVVNTKGQTLPLSLNVPGTPLVPKWLAFSIFANDHWGLCLVYFASDLVARHAEASRTKVVVFETTGGSLEGADGVDAYVHAVLVRVSQASGGPCRPAKEVGALPVAYLQVGSPILAPQLELELKFTTRCLPTTFDRRSLPFYTFCNSPFVTPTACGTVCR